MVHIVGICVNPTDYESAAQIFGDTFSMGVRHAQSSLQGALTGTDRTAGHDAAGVAFAKKYDEVATPTLQQMPDLARAAAVTGTLLQQSGFNHARADAYSNITGGSVLQAPATDFDTEFGECTYAPSVKGGAVGDFPLGWEAVQQFVGDIWPDGDPGKLRGMAAAWRSAATALEQAADTGDRGLDALEYVDSPEIESARIVCGDLGDSAFETGQQCRTIATGCDEMADHIEKTRQKIIGELGRMLAEIAALELIAFAAGSVTFGAGTAAGQVAVAAEAASAGARITAICARLLEAASLTGGRLAAGTYAAMQVAKSRVGVILSLTPKGAEAVTAAAAAKGLEHGATQISAIWLKGWQERGLAIEEQLGGNLPPFFPTIDKVDWATGKVTSIKSMDLNAVTYQNASRLKSRLKRYVDSAANFTKGQRGYINIQPRDVKSRALQVAVPRAPNAEQQGVFDSMVGYAKEHGVELIVTVV